MRVAKIEHPEVEYLDEDEILALFEAIHPATGRRNRALLLLLYNTGARVQEVVDLDIADFDPEPVSTSTINEGKTGFLGPN